MIERYRYILITGFVDEKSVKNDSRIYDYCNWIDGAAFV